MLRASLAPAPASEQLQFRTTNLVIHSKCGMSKEGEIIMSVTQTTPRRNNRRSREIFAEAEKVLVGGVNSPVRAFRSVGGEPLIIERGQGQYLYDADGNQLLDFVCSWGAMLLGHANPTGSAAIAR